MLKLLRIFIIGFLQKLNLKTETTQSVKHIFKKCFNLSYLLFNINDP